MNTATWLPTIEAAAALGCTPKALRRAAKANKLRYQVATTAILDYFAAAFGKNGSWKADDPKKISRVMSRLRENRCNISEIFYAIDGARGDKWMQDHKTAQQVNIVLVDREKVEKFVGLSGWDGETPHPTYLEMGGA